MDITFNHSWSTYFGYVEDQIAMHRTAPRNRELCKILANHYNKLQTPIREMSPLRVCEDYDLLQMYENSK